MNKNSSYPQRTQRSTPTTTTGPKRRSLPPPMTLGDFALSLLLHVCRKYVLFNIELKIGVYCLIVLFGSFMSDLIHLPRFYIAQKYSVFNVIFVKWCWAWTLIVIGTFVYFSSTVYSAGDKRNVRQQIARLIVGTFVWFTVTSLFTQIQKIAGYCSKNYANSTNPISCASGGGRWVSFDISGHVFMLIYICLLNEEELRVFRNWDQIKVLVDSAMNDPPELMLLTKSEIEHTRILYIEHTRKIRGLFILATIFNFMWELMLVISTLYYHRPVEKFAAAFFAIFCWFITYRIWFRSEFSPGLPGHCKIKYIKDRTSRR